ncbi:Endonuclease/exonuclease/phosphatase, partial [Suillus ampliporus]
MTPEVLDGVIRVQACRQPNGFPRMDMWVEARVAAGIKLGMYLSARQRRQGTTTNNKFPMYKLAFMWRPNAQTSHWRLDVWKSWRDRSVEKPPMRLTVRPPPQQGFATLNVNGMGAKQPELENFLRWADIGILAIQETLIGQKKYRFYLPGYETYTRPAGNGFRGQALLVSHAYPSYEVSRCVDQSFIHIRVAKLRGKSPWHVISVYFPSGGNRRSERTQCLIQVLNEYRAIMAKDPQAVVIIMGDFNMPREKLIKGIRTERTGLVCLPISGCGLTFHRKGSKWTDVDSVLVSPACRAYMRPAKVVRN